MKIWFLGNVPHATKRKATWHVKVNGPCVQSFCIEKDSYMDAI